MNVRRREMSEAQRLDIVLRYVKIKDGASNETLNDLCTCYGIHRNTPSKLLKRAKDSGTLKNKNGRGRWSKVKNVDIQENFVECIRENRKASLRKLAARLNISRCTAGHLRKNLKFRKCKRISRPPLSAAHMERRLTFVQDNPVIHRTTAFLDEKWFETFREKKAAYFRDNSPKIFVHPPSRRFPPRIMFVAVVSQTAPDGKVGLWEAAEERQYPRNSRHHQRGESYWKDISIDGNYFTRLLDDEIMPRCEQMGITEIQMDNARPHLIECEDASITRIQARHPNVRLIYQPAQSPDTNPLDEGIFKMLADAVELSDPKNRNDLVVTVKDEWNRLERRKIVHHIINQRVVRRKILLQNGGNRFV